MSRYIDVDKLSEMIEARAKTLVEGKEAFYYIANWFNKLPPADVTEVRHGRAVVHISPPVPNGCICHARWEIRCTASIMPERSSPGPWRRLKYLKVK